MEDKGKKLAEDSVTDQRMARKPATDGVLDPRLVRSPPLRTSRALAARLITGHQAVTSGSALARSGRQQPVQHVRDVQPEAERVHRSLWCGQPGQQLYSSGLSLCS